MPHSPRLDAVHRLVCNALTLARLGRWQANVAKEFRRLLAPLAG